MPTQSPAWSTCCGRSAWRACSMISARAALRAARGEGTRRPWRDGASVLPIRSTAVSTMEHGQHHDGERLPVRRPRARRQQQDRGGRERRLSAVSAMSGELGSMPSNLLVGVRYEETDVASTSNILVPNQPGGMVWTANNDFTIGRSATVQPFTEETDYSHVLPSLDFDMMLTDAVKGRMSYSKTIARANYGDLYRGRHCPRCNGLGPDRSLDPGVRRRAEPCAGAARVGQLGLQRRVVLLGPGLCLRRLLGEARRQLHRHDRAPAKPVRHHGPDLRTGCSGGACLPAERGVSDPGHRSRRRRQRRLLGERHCAVHCARNAAQ